MDVLKEIGTCATKSAMNEKSAPDLSKITICVWSVRMNWFVCLCCHQTRPLVLLGQLIVFLKLRVRSLLLVKSVHQPIKSSRLIIEKPAIVSKEPPVKTGGILEFKQSLAAVFFALHLNILLYRRFLYANR